MSKHALQRAAERMGIRADASDMHKMLVDIQQGRAVLLDSDDRRGGMHWLANLAGKPVRVVTPMTCDAVLTVLPHRRLRQTIENRHREHCGNIGAKRAARRQRANTMEDEA